MVASLVVVAVVSAVSTEDDALSEKDVLLVAEVVDNVRALKCECMYLGEMYDAEEIEDERDARAEREVVAEVEVVRVRVRMYRGARECDGRKERAGVEGADRRGAGEALTKRSLQDEGIMRMFARTGEYMRTCACKCALQD